MLNMTTYGDDTGDDTGPPILIVHGLFGSARNWRAIAKRMAMTRRVVTVDMRNHGQSPRHASQSYDDMATDLAKVIEGLGGHVDVIGHSMGGKSAMVLALSNPAHVRRLLVADIAPVAYSHTQAHLIAAMRDLDLGAIDTRAQADAALTPSVPDAATRAFLLQSLDVQDKSWRLNHDVLEDYMPGLIGFPVVSGQFTGPSLFLSGAESDYVRREHRPLIKQHFPEAKFAKIPGAGHWLHAEKPREFIAAAQMFLAS